MTGIRLLIRRSSFVLMILYVSVLNAHQHDSLVHSIQSYKGIPRIDARLQLAFEYRRSDFEGSARQSKAAIKEAQALGLHDREARALHYLGLTYHYHTFTDSALYFLNRSAEIYRSEKNYEQLAKVMNMVGTCYLGLTGDQQKAIEYYNESMHYARMSSDHMTLAVVYSHLSNIFRMNGAYEKSMDFIYRSKEEYEKAGYTEGIAWINFSIGRIYNTMSLYDEAKEAFLEGLEVYYQEPESVTSKTGIAICLDELALAYVETGDIDKAYKHNAMALELYTELKNEFGLSNALKHRARIKYLSGRREDALGDLDRSLQIKKRMNDVLGLPAIYGLYGQMLFDNGQYSQAIDSLYVGLSYAKNNDQKTRIVDVNKQLARIFNATEEYDKAFEHQSKQVAVMDSIYGSKATRGMTQLESMYQLESKQRRIDDLQQDNLIKELELKREKVTSNLLLIILGLTVIFVLILTKLFINNRKARRELEISREKLQELNATKDKFFSIIAHDLKSPFNTIIGFSGLMERYSKEEDFDKIKDFSGHIREVSIQTFNLLENLLDWSRSQTGKISFTLKPLDISFAIRNAVDLLYPQASQKDIIIETDTNSIIVNADENMIHTILQNLLSNAIKYSHPGGSIRILTQENAGMLSVRICDEGIGMDEDTRRNLFQIDENVSQPGTRGEKGTGLGLILCKEFVLKHGGDISVESEPGKGACFTFSIPKSPSKKTEKQ